VKREFLAQDQDRVGAVYNVLQRLTRKNINVVAVDAVAAGKKQFGMILWVKPKDYLRAATALIAK
jgi:predicted amino acid-binding ACT domain protein